MNNAILLSTFRSVKKPQVRLPFRFSWYLKLNFCFCLFFFSRMRILFAISFVLLPLHRRSSWTSTGNGRTSLLLYVPIFPSSDTRYSFKTAPPALTALLSLYRYHCHTCKMVDGVGVCTVCAKVCHKDHEISYAKYGSFFCDCGAKEDGSCQVRPNTSSHHGKRTTAVTLACKSVIIEIHELIPFFPSVPSRILIYFKNHVFFLVNLVILFACDLVRY